MDLIDREIIRALMGDGRMTNAALAQSVGLSASATLERLRRLEQSGVVAGFSLRVDPKEVGRGLEAFLAFTLKKQEPEEVESLYGLLRDHDAVLDCSQVMGRFDLIAHVAVENIEELGSFIDEQFAGRACIDRVETMTVLDTLKRNHPPYPRVPRPEPLA